jgi:hypothetical protein
LPVQTATDVHPKASNPSAFVGSRDTVEAAKLLLLGIQIWRDAAFGECEPYWNPSGRKQAHNAQRTNSSPGIPAKAQLNGEFDDVVPGTEREIIPEDAGMGEGCHLYKIRGKYYITSAWYAGEMRMPSARADRLEGPYEVNLAISKGEDFGLAEGYRLGPGKKPPYTIIPPRKEERGRVSFHQGGVVDTPSH